MVLDSIRRRIRTSGSNLALAGRDGSWPGFGPIRLVSGPDYWPARSFSGVTITDEAALGLSAAYRSIVLIATTAGGQPIHVYEVDGDGNRNRVEDDATRYLWDRPNPEMTNQTFWETVIGHEVMGDAFLFIVKNRREQPLELWYIEPWRVRTGRTSEGRKVYEVDNEYVLVDFADGGEVIHVPNWGRDSLRGISPIKVANSAISLGISAQEYAERFFSQDSTPRGVLTSDQVLSPEQADALSARWTRLNSGPANAHRTAVLGAGAKFQAVSVSPEDAQLLEERRFQLAEIARLFGVPPHMLGDTERSTSWGTGIEEQTRGFLTFTLQAHINRFEQAINYALLRRAETRRYVRFDMTGLLRPNALQQAQLHALGYGRWLTPNDIRRDLDLPPVEGGDELLAAQNLVPLDQLSAVQGTGEPADLPGGGDL